jgi:SpoVK/Ycf46/Vps4 family AAA+-type ATPase
LLLKLEVGMPKVPAFFVHAGVKLNSIALEFARSGPAAATINAIAQGETRFGTSQGGTPTSLTFSRISQFQGSIKRAGSPVGNLTGGSMTYSNNLEKIETIRDDGLIEGADPTIAALTGRIDVRFADTTLIDLAAGGTPVDLEFAYTLSAQAKLVLTAHEVYLPKPKLAVEGPGGVQASFDFRGAKNDVAEIRRVLNSFLQFLEQDDSDSLVLAATNYAAMLDEALFRRFDDVIHYERPDTTQIEQLIRNRLHVLLGKRTAWRTIREAASGLSHAEIARACDDAAKECILSDRERIDTKTLVAALKERHRPAIPANPENK